MKKNRVIKWAWPPLSIIEQIAQWDQLYMDPAWRLSQWHLLSSPDYHLAQVYSDKDLVAFALFYLPSGVDTAHLLKIVVSPELRGQSLGIWLLEHSEIMMGNLGAERVFLEVDVDNLSAQKLYQKWGMSYLYRQKNFYGQGRDALTMQKECKKTKTPN